MNVDLKEQHRRNMVVMDFINGAISGNVQGFMASLEGIDWLGAWRGIFEKVVQIGYVHPDARMAFRTAWRGNVENSGSPYVLAEQKRKGRWSLTDDFENDLDLMAAGLKLLMPPPVETSPVYCLYRGQDHAAHVAGRHGVWWTADPIYAEIYARSPARAPSGRGVVLAAFVPGDAIVTALCTTEFLIDPRRLDSVVSVAELLPYQPDNLNVDFWTPQLIGVPMGYDADGLDEWLAADRPVAGLASCRAAREPRLADIRASIAA